jgi:hypothetical protein
MQDPEIESLLRRYRPREPSDALFDRITRSPNHPTTRSERTWPWAIAAAALLALTVGLHGAASLRITPEQPLVDPVRVQAVVDDLGGPQNRALAEWIVQQEARADREARLARASEGDGWNRR